MINIINSALNFLGQQSITSLNDANDRARKCKQFYDICRKELLRKHDWGFAQEEIELCKLDKEDYLGRKFVYAYPQNVLFIKDIFNEECIRNKRNFEYRVGMYDKKKVICTNEGKAKAIVTKDVQDPSLFDVTFKEALSYLLASKVALALTGDSELLKLAYQQYQITLGDATLVNKQEEPTELKFESDFWKVR